MDVASNIPMQDPIAFFFTWPTYGTWLPGDERGWVDYLHGWKLPDLDLEYQSRMIMAEPQCLLTSTERLIVTSQVEETCQHRDWNLFAVACRSNHMHLVVGAHETHPKKIRIDIKAWCTRRLKERSDPSRMHWWAERGSIRWVWNENSLETVVQYVKEAQDRKGLA